MRPTDDILKEHDVLVAGDNDFQRWARLAQSRWRMRRGLESGLHNGSPLGSTLAMPAARETLANYLTDNVRALVRAEMATAFARGKKVQEPRIYDNLLSSQPLCFNLFGELAVDHALASAVFERLLVEPGLRVTRVELEHSPGRGDPVFTNDHSAFDVYVEYESASGTRGFVGIEMKYAETMKAKPARHRSRYDEVADAMGCFVPEQRAALRAAPLEQLWRDHLLAGSLLLHEPSGFARGVFAVVAPAQNTAVRDAVARYRAALGDNTTFRSWTLESVVAAVATATSAEWVAELRERYVPPQKLTELDRLVLSRIYAETTPLGAAVRAGFETAEVLERDFTGAGVYVTIRFAGPLPDGGHTFLNDWNFEHPSLRHGGSFVCRRQSDNTVLLEGFTYDDPWSAEMAVDDFRGKGR